MIFRQWSVNITRFTFFFWKPTHFYDDFYCKPALISKYVKSYKNRPIEWREALKNKELRISWSKTEYNEIDCDLEKGYKVSIEIEE